MGNRFFIKCGMVILILPLVAALFFLAGCLEKSPDISKAVSETHTNSAVLCPSGLQVDFDSDVSSSLFRVKGFLTPMGNGSFPYLLLNATLLEDGVKLKSTKYLMIDVNSGGDHGFEIAKNMFTPRGNYSCALEISGPTGVLACETRGCKVTQPWTEPSMEPSMEPSSAPAEMPGEVRPNEVVFEKTNFQPEESDRSGGDFEGNEEALQRESGAEKSPRKAEETGAQAADRVSVSESDSQGSGSHASLLQIPEKRNASPDRAGKSAKKAASTPVKKYDGKGADGNSDVRRADANAGTTTADAKFVGSSTSKKYHRPDCRYAQKIKPENRIYFSSEEEAQSQGYLPCKICIP